MLVETDVLEEVANFISYLGNSIFIFMFGLDEVKSHLVNLFKCLSTFFFVLFSQLLNLFVKTAGFLF